MPAYSYTQLSGNLTLGGTDDKITTKNAEGSGIYKAQIDTGDGNDTILTYTKYQGVSESTINLGAGNDELVASKLSDENSIGLIYWSTIDAGDGDDILDIKTAFESTFKGGAGKDTVIFKGNRIEYNISFY